MLKFERLEKNLDIEQLLTPKKKLFDLINKVNGSMLEFHKTLKTSKEIEVLAAEFFKAKNDMKRFIQSSGHINLEVLKTKINNMKNISISDDEDFV